MSKKLITKPLEFIDLFSGCGGFSTGLEMAGHKCLLGVDFNVDAIKSFDYNHYHSNSFCGDIKKLTPTHLYKLLNGKKKVDMVVGGPPCQGFSTVGRGKADDDRNSLFKEFVRVVKLLSPKIILFENVTGMLAQKNRKTLHNIFSEFEKLGYQMDARVMSAHEYGVPTTRRRAIIMGVKGGACMFPEKSSLDNPLTVREAIGNIRSIDGQTYNHDTSGAKIKNQDDAKRLKHIPTGAGIRYERDQKKYLPKSLWYDVNWQTLREKRFRQTRLQRLAWDLPSPTILTSRTSYYHPKDNRYLTIREAAACQSFPNEFVFQGSLTSAFRQIGNAVPPGLAMAIGEVLYDIEKKSVRKNLSKDLEDDHFTEKSLGDAFRYQRPTT
ncbi:DNA cytosine methyltransferase [Bacteriovoracaceae bacterium]|nr:DNA cytosine methyltransferase [Bacteriovoracaceae bacterium]